jgi:hypothetical protein
VTKVTFFGGVLDIQMRAALERDHIFFQLLLLLWSRFTRFFLSKIAGRQSLVDGHCGRSSPGNLDWCWFSMGKKERRPIYTGSQTTQNIGC